MRKDRNKCIIGEHNKKEQSAEKKRKLENSRWVTVRQNETIPHTMRSCEIEQEEKKWEETAGKNKKMRDSNTIKKYLVTKNQPGDKNETVLEEPGDNAELSGGTPANIQVEVSRDDLAYMPANVLGENEEPVDKNEPVMEEPGDNAEYGDLADMPVNVLGENNCEEETVTMEDVTYEEGGPVEDMDKEPRPKKKRKEEIGRSFQRKSC